MPQTARNFFSTEEKDDIKQAILDAELNTSGEIRVHIDNKHKGDVLEKAALIFKQLQMHQTEQHNGVLFYLAIQNRTFAIIGDSAIDAVVSENFWESTKLRMINQFRDGRFTQGLVEGIQEAGIQLKKHFPYQADDVNELSDEISFGDD